MIDPQLYYGIYLTLIFVLTLICSSHYSRYTDGRLGVKLCEKSLSTFIVSIFFILFIGFRPKSGVFIDMMNYDYMFKLLEGQKFNYSIEETNVVFDNLFKFLATSGFDIEIFFLIMSALYFGGILIACRKLFPKDSIYAYVIYLGAFSTFSYATNGIKAGVAASLFLCALGFYKRKYICVFFLVLSLGFHHSMALPIIAFICCLLLRRPKVYLYIWILSLIIAAAHITIFQSFLGGFADESGAEYLTVSDMGYRTGFRLDFIIYSAAPVVLGYFIIKKFKYNSRTYNLLYNTYLLTNAVWMLCMYASFTNRIAYLSWFMLPIVLAYPFFDMYFIKNQYQKLNVVAWGNLGFTITMQVVYYGFIK